MNKSAIRRMMMGLRGFLTDKELRELAGGRVTAKQARGDTPKKYQRIGDFGVDIMFFEMGYRAAERRTYRKVLEQCLGEIMRLEPTVRLMEIRDRWAKLIRQKM
jgi:hypothetical protein